MNPSHRDMQPHRYRSISSTLIIRVLIKFWQSGPASANRRHVFADGYARLPDAHIGGFTAFRAVNDLEYDVLTVVESFESVDVDFGPVDEHILLAVYGDKPVSLIGIEPLDGAVDHRALLRGVVLGAVWPVRRL